MSGDAPPELRPWSELQHLPGEELIRMFEESTMNLGIPAPRHEVFVRRIGTDVVMKTAIHGNFDAKHLRVVRENTSVLVPDVLREIPVLRDLSYPVIEYIPGRNLRECWSQLSFFRKLWVIWTLRGYVRQLRSIPHTVPWPGAVSDKPELCCGELFPDGQAGPFATHAELLEWFHHKRKVANYMNPKIERFKHLKDPGPLPITPLVFTHFDLKPRNVMLGDNGRLWLIDFGLSGFYPEWFEYATMFDWENLGWMGKFARLAIGGFRYRWVKRYLIYISWAVQRCEIWYKHWAPTPMLR